MRKTSNEAKEAFGKRKLVMILAVVATVIGLAAPNLAGAANADEWTCVPAYGYTCFRTDTP